MLTRRGFLQRIGAAAVALTLARHLPGIAPEPLSVPTEPSGWTQAFTRGDVFTIEGVYEINPFRWHSAEAGLQAMAQVDGAGV